MWIRDIIKKEYKDLTREQIIKRLSKVVNWEYVWKKEFDKK